MNENGSVSPAELRVRRAAARMFLVAWGYFGVVAALGALLRMQLVFPVAGVDFGNLLHTHSHIAFLGWVYNAFFALAVRFFVPPDRLNAYVRLFVATQAAVVGMLVAFPIQGYALASIVFSSLHMICAAIFVIKLLLRNRAGSAAEAFLRAAGVFILISSLGPLAVAPVSVAGLRDSAWYDLTIAYYLHFQYNGWFLFFLMAAVLQTMHERGGTAFAEPARRSLFWLVSGCVLTFSLSALPMGPPLWVFALAGAGGVAQCIGCFHWLRAVLGGEPVFNANRCRIVRWLAGGALGLFLVKVALQALAAWSGLMELATNHFTIIAFMHLVFLGITAPMLAAWALDQGWLRCGTATITAVIVFATGAFVSQLALAYLPLAGAFGWPAWPAFNETQFAAALLMFLGIAAAGLDRWARGAEAWVY